MQHPIITIFCPFTRAYLVNDWLGYLKVVKHEPALTNLCFIIDCNEPGIQRKLERFGNDNGYRSIHTRLNPDWRPNETRLTIRRMRVADVHNQSKSLIAKTDGDIVIGFEDDTVFSGLTDLSELYGPLIEQEKVGFVQGVQMGRWGAKIIGAWLKNDPKHIQTLLPPQDGTKYQEISAGGFYGYATLKHLYLNHDYYTSSGQPYGPDVNYGLWVGEQGYKLLINWQVEFGHRVYNEVAYPSNPKYRLTEIHYIKNADTGKWDRSDYEQART